MTTAARTGSSGCASRPRSKAASRSPRSATRSSDDRSGAPNVDVAEVPSRSTIPRTTGSRWARPPGSRSARQGPPPPRFAPRARSAWPRSIVPDDPAQDAAFGASSSRSFARASPRRSRGTTAAATACSTSTPTCRTSGSRSAARPRIGSLPPCSMPPIRAIAPSSSDSWRQAASARVRVPENGATRDRAEPITDLRGASDLPVLVVAGSDPSATTDALEALTKDLADGIIWVDQPVELDAATGRTEDYTVAVLNRGMPGFNVEADGSLYLSLMRSCSGWPSGSGSTHHDGRRPMGRTSNSSTGATPSTTRWSPGPGIGVTGESCGQATTTTTRSSPEASTRTLARCHRRRPSSRSSPRPSS